MIYDLHFNEWIPFSILLHHYLLIVGGVKYHKIVLKNEKRAETIGIFFQLFALHLKQNSNVLYIFFYLYTLLFNGQPFLNFDQPPPVLF